MLLAPGCPLDHAYQPCRYHASQTFQLLQRMLADTAKANVIGLLPVVQVAAF